MPWFVSVPVHSCCGLSVQEFWGGGVVKHVADSRFVRKSGNPVPSQKTALVCRNSGGQSPAGFLSQNLGFNLKAVHVRFVVDQVAL